MSPALACRMPAGYLASTLLTLPPLKFIILLEKSFRAPKQIIHERLEELSGDSRFSTPIYCDANNDMTERGKEAC